MSGVALVQFSEVNLSKLLPLCRQALDRGLADSADTAGCEPPLNHMLCIANMKADVKASAASVIPYMHLFHAGFIIAADERDCTEILELASMPSIVTPSIKRDISVMFIAGTLTQWRDAILKGCQREISSEVRQVFNSVYTEFKNIGLAGAFNFKSTEGRDRTFILEFKP